MSFLFWTLGAENETRTRDPNLGKVVRYQLSYFRNTNILKFYDYNLFDCECKGTTIFLFSKHFRNFFLKKCNFFFIAKIAYCQKH